MGGKYKQYLMAVFNLIIGSPLWFTLGILSIIFFVEMAIMYALYFWLFFPPFVEALINAFFLIIFILPIIFFLRYRPFERHKKKQNEAKEELNQITRFLEKHARTSKDIEAIRVYELKRSIKALQKSEMSYKSLAENFSECISLIDLEGRFVYMNPAGLKIYGLNLESIQGEYCIAFIKPPYHKLQTQMINKAIKGETVTYRYECEAVGENRWLESVLSPIRNDAGEVVSLICLSLDTTEYKHSEEIMQGLLESAPDAMVIVNQQGQIVLVNAQTEKKFGYNRRELMGENIEILVPHRFRKKHVGYRNDYFKAPKERPLGIGMELVALRKDDTEFPVEINLSPLRTSEGIFVVSAVRDITERRNAALAFQESQEQLRQSQKMDALGRLAGGITHDFNSILTAILGSSSSLLKQFDLKDPRREEVEEIKKTGEQAVALTRQLLAFSRKQTVIPQVIDLNKLIENTVRLLKRLIAGDIELCLDLSPQLGYIKMDPGQMEQVLVNLVVNAKDAISKKGKIILKTKAIDEVSSTQYKNLKPGAYILLSVQDNGIGISPEIQSKMFDPFFTTKTKDKGTGLGLSTVYGIVKQSGGDIFVESERGKGATFKVFLPKIEPAKGS